MAPVPPSSSRSLRPWLSGPHPALPQAALFLLRQETFKSDAAHLADLLTAHPTTGVAPPAATLHQIARRFAIGSTSSTKSTPPNPSPSPFAAALVLSPADPLPGIIARLRTAHSPDDLATLPQAILPHPALSPASRVAFVFPGSGSHHLGMGLAHGAHFPAVLDAIDAENLHLASQMAIREFAPLRADFSGDWKADALARAEAALEPVIFAHVSHGVTVATILQSLGVRPSASVGYSLGESTGYFSLGVWRDRDLMYRRMMSSDLFSRWLGGKCEAARIEWDIPAGEPVDWITAVLPRPAAQVREALPKFPRAYLLIVNTPTECVVGGWRPQVEELARTLETGLIPLPGVPTVHCAVARHAEKAYYDLHVFDAKPQPDVTFYSVAFGKPHEPTSESAAHSITDDALFGFDFPAVVERMVADGVGIFIEIGPRAWTTRMIQKIAGDRALAIAADSETDDVLTPLLRVLGALAVHGKWDRLDLLYPAEPVAEAAAAAAVDGPGGNGTKPTKRARWTVSTNSQRKSLVLTLNSGTAADSRGTAVSAVQAQAAKTTPAPQQRGPAADNSGTAVSAVASPAKETSPTPQPAAAVLPAFAAQTIPTLATGQGYQANSAAWADTGGTPVPLPQTQTSSVSGQGYQATSAAWADTGGTPVPLPQTQTSSVSGQGYQATSAAWADTGGTPVPLSQTQPSSVTGHSYQATAAAWADTGGTPVPLSQTQPSSVTGQGYQATSAAWADTGGTPVPLSQSQPSSATGQGYQATAAAWADTGGTPVPLSQTQPSSVTGQGYQATSAAWADTGGTPVPLSSFSTPEWIAAFQRARDAEATAHSLFLSITEEAAAQTAALTARLLQEPPPHLPKPSLPCTAHRPVQSNQTDHTDMVNQAASSAASIQSSPSPLSTPSTTPPQPAPFLDRAQCLEFARGSIAAVLGPEFAVVDTYPTRVRLPDEPLMLCDRVMLVEGTKGVLGPGRVVTEHDVLPGKWYLDHGRMPVCVAVESGQADLFLSAYLGIDLQTKGRRVYRLLDAEITFHRHLPVPGEVIRYDIHIDRFVQSGETWLFFFRFEGTIAGQPLLSMRNGCAGFFTYEEIAGSGGIVVTPEERRAFDAEGGKCTLPDLPVPGPVAPALSIEQVDAIRAGDLSPLGPAFASLPLSRPATIPGGLMRLVHRAVSIQPKGGTHGLGFIRAEADIRPDDWFLTCHFVDDRVMPGTLMYECCAHTLRLLLMAKGWVCESGAVAYDIVPGRTAKLRCRGPVTEKTKVVTYELTITEIGITDTNEPYVVAEAMMHGDGEPIVRFTGMSMKLTGVTFEDLQSLWNAGANGANRTSKTVRTDRTSRAQENDQSDQSTPSTLSTPSTVSPSPIGGAPVPVGPAPALFPNSSIVAFAEGEPSEAFGAPYRPFDHDGTRRIARLPRDPYKFLDRVTRIEGYQPFELAAPPGAWIEAQYDVPPDAWYFPASGQGAMPFAVLLEIALQPCGWLAAYLGSALRNTVDLRFRNLGGKAVLLRPVRPDAGTLSIRVSLTKFSEAGGMIIQDFAMQVWQGAECVYDGTTNFGFFTTEALANQLGVRDASRRRWSVPAAPAQDPIELPRRPPMRPAVSVGPAPVGPPAALDLPAAAYLMFDRVLHRSPNGGLHGLGHLLASKTVNPDEWFFHAHFYQDPVCPGSLGLESFLQLLQWELMERLRAEGRPLAGLAFEPIATGADRPHTWVYRGQVIPRNKLVTLEANITHYESGPVPRLRANGFLLVDGLPIYEMQDFEVVARPV